MTSTDAERAVRAPVIADPDPEVAGPVPEVAGPVPMVDAPPPEADDPEATVDVGRVHVPVRRGPVAGTRNGPATLLPKMKKTGLPTSTWLVVPWSSGRKDVSILPPPGLTDY